jgi:5S rRNA maturation endonuclease (ribonuclease M5)
MRKDAKKIIITKAPDGHYVYTDAHNESDNGSIIDICQRLTGKNLGQVRRELRPWIGKGQDRPRPPIEAWQKIYRTEPDYIKVAIGFNNAEPVFDFSYFDERGIDKTVVNSFPSTIRQSSDGMLLFRHIKKNVYLSGYEKKNAGYTGFSKGGKKGVCVFHDGQNKVDNLVITETAIDALSKAQLDGLPESTAYCSIGGTPSEEQIFQLAEIVKNNKLRAIIAVDRDQGGERITQSIRTLLPDAEIVLPKKKDWNDDLKEKIEKEERWEKRNNSVRDSSHENDNEPSM